ncbi:MAG TPA: hypothetical protein PKX74_06315, partial [Leptospiraceae bacterium]|nr:hypothetical protein [Leptospiraceae bacterium]
MKSATLVLIVTLSMGGQLLAQTETCSRGDCKNGPGTLQLPNGSRYEGEFKNGNFHGQGVYTLPSGVYTGEFKDNKIEGKGVFLLKTGRKLEG